MRTTVREPAPGTTWELDGYHVVSPATRTQVREAVLDEADVFIFDTAEFDAVGPLIRWVDTMTTAAVIGVVGDVPDDISDLVDAQCTRPLDPSTVESLTDRVRDRRASLRALDEYQEAVDDDSDHAVAAARRAADELTADLDPSDRRAVLDAIGG